ncbi:MAG TPA: PilZ domain-containing protein [Candidatus Polarisedimenticolaceae bacterium]|nr:PilZ domain-containing protein [Candidatus Polarisedimenticolaceae bacterium]
MDDGHHIPPGETRKQPSRWRRIVSGHLEEPPRRGFRFPVSVEAELHDPSGSFHCAAENLSRTGVLLVGELPPPSQERVDLTLKDRTGSHQARLTGRVIRATSDETSSSLSLAIEFVDMDEVRRDDLEILLARLLEGGTAPGPFDSLKPGVSPLEVKKVLEGIPLQQRLKLASRAPLRDREFLRQDTNAAVLDALIRNPNVVLAEARAIAAVPFLSPSSIESLATDPRFLGDEDLLIALTSHPKIAPPTLERLMTQVKMPQVRRLLAKPGLSPALRDRLLKRATRG